ncbi:Maltose permease MAL61 [Echinococcus multilocularis]|uniref:Maltose permease MAL61 n=1 Tax=Echinococcus multilocularis TaxID=6211 RepID=A0A0S4MJ89_ECHMU|nr:Maltose permease MAL61 [Echinococcus multilocularis]
MTLKTRSRRLGQCLRAAALNPTACARFARGFLLLLLSCFCCWNTSYIWLIFRIPDPATAENRNIHFRSHHICWKY